MSITINNIKGSNDNVQTYEVFESEDNNTYSIVCALQEEVKQLSYEKTNLNKTLETLEDEANKSETKLHDELKLLRKENLVLKDKVKDIELLREKYQIAKDRFEARDQELQELDLYNAEQAERIEQLLCEVKSKEDIIKILKESFTDLDPNSSSGDRAENVGFVFDKKQIKAKNKSKTLNRSISAQNRFSVLDGHHVKNYDSGHETKSNLNRKPRPKVKTFETPRSIRGPVFGLKKVVLLGDSHVRGLAAKVSPLLGDSVLVTGMVKPGARLDQIISSLKHNELDETKPKNDISECLVLVGGTNDVCSGKIGDCLHRLEQVIQSFTNLTTIVGNIPHRHDLAYNHKINNDIWQINQELQEIVNKCKRDNVKIIDLYNFPRYCHTTHGFHFNNKGKRFLSKTVVNVLREVSKEYQQTESIILDKPASPIQKIANMTPVRQTNNQIAKELTVDQQSSNSDKSRQTISLNEELSSPHLEVPSDQVPVAKPSEQHVTPLDIPPAQSEQVSPSRDLQCSSTEKSRCVSQFQYNLLCTPPPCLVSGFSTPDDSKLKQLEIVMLNLQQSEEVNFSGHNEQSDKVICSNHAGSVIAQDNSNDTYFLRKRKYVKKKS